MPIIISQDLPAAKVLKEENIFALTDFSASKQDIRPLKIGIVNLMPNKIQTETQLLRLLSLTPLQIDIRLVRMANHVSKNTSESHLKKFYRTVDEMKQENLDGLIITGAPVEKKAFTEVDYWHELVDIMEWSQTHCTSVLHICWGAQAGLFHHYGVDKIPYDEKVFGIFAQKIQQFHPIVRGFSDYFFSPQSRYTGINQDQLVDKSLEIIASSSEIGASMLYSLDSKNIFLLGHFEYDTMTLKEEYERDVAIGLDTKKPENYFRFEDCTQEIQNTWRSNASLLFMNWIHDTYQRTPFNLSDVGMIEFHHPDETITEY